MTTMSFFSYSHTDKESVGYIANKLKNEYGTTIFFDEWSLIPGKKFQDELSKGLEKSSSCAVFIGANTTSGWKMEEVSKAIDMQTQDNNFNVIPVLLPNAKKENLNGFLQSCTCVEFKELDDSNALYRLHCGINNTAPLNPDSKFITTK